MLIAYFISSLHILSGSVITCSDRHAYILWLILFGPKLYINERPHVHINLRFLASLYTPLISKRTSCSSSPQLPSLSLSFYTLPSIAHHSRQPQHPLFLFPLSVIQMKESIKGFASLYTLSVVSLTPSTHQKLPKSWLYPSNTINSPEIAKVVALSTQFKDPQKCSHSHCIFFPCKKHLPESWVLRECVLFIYIKGNKGSN